jgi:hypothetical protein
MEASVREEVDVTGQVTGVEVKPNGRFVIKVKQNPTDEYDITLHTKDQGMAQFLMGQANQMFHFRCGLSHYNLPDGKPVTSKWINQYAPMGQDVAPPAQPSLLTDGQPAVPTPAPVRGPREDKDLKITWLAMAKGLAVECYKRLPTEQQTLDNAVRIADYWARVAVHRGAHGIPEWDAPVLDPSDVYQEGGPAPDEANGIPF